MKKNNRKWLLLFWVFPLCLPARANNGKSDAPLQGYVTDATTKKPLPGVIVSASLSGSNASKEVVTDAEGYFSFDQLPLTSLTLLFDKKGYQPFKKAGIVLREKTPTKINVECAPLEIPENLDDTEYPLLRMMHIN
jgi:hypothetical protein